MISRGRFTLVVLALLVLGTPPARSEVSIGEEGPTSNFLYAAGGDDPTAYPWGRVRRHAASGLFLQPDADQALNGPMDFAINPSTHRPEVVWSRFDGNDFEIALSRWDGTAWSDPEFLTDNTVDDLDPAIAFTHTGSALVSWWREEGERQVWFLEKAEGTDWSEEDRVTVLPQTGSLPAVAASASGTRVAFQAPGGTGTEIVVSNRETGWSRVVVGETAYQGPGGDGCLYARLHSRDGRLWVDWIDGPGEMGYSVYDPQTDSWSAPAYESYSWNPEVGESEYWERERARARIALAVLF